MWYLDGQIVNSCNDKSKIPQHPLKLKVTHSVKHDVFAAEEDEESRSIIWTGSDEMVVDYIRYYKIKTDCGTDVVIEDIDDWNQCTDVKKNITIETTSDFVVPTNSTKCLRATNKITISRGTKFTIPIGSKVAFIPHECVNYEEENTNNNNQ